MRRKTRVTRHLTMSEAADLLGVRDYKIPHHRTRYVRRIFRRLEERDGCRYLKKEGKNYVVSVEDLERARPWHPSTLMAVRADVDEVGEEVSTLKKRVNGHGSKLRDHSKRIKNLEEFRRLSHEYLSRVNELL